MLQFQQNDISLESQWRALILFGKNSATYKFAFAKALLQLIEQEKTRISLQDLSSPFVDAMLVHLKQNDKQGNSSSSTFLNACRQHLIGELSYENLLAVTEKYGFVNVVDAFQNVNGGTIPNVFYEKNYIAKNKEIIITDNLLKLKESVQVQNFSHEVDARWNLVETAWNLNLNPKLLEVQYDDENGQLFLENDFMRRIDITGVRDALNGYQKGKCFFSFQDISIVPNSENLCHVDHFLPHTNKFAHHLENANINGVWNLVLADGGINNDKRAKIPERKYLERLYKRNEFYIESKHPLHETIINQTGNTPDKRAAFLNKQYQIALENSIQTWSPAIELPATF